MHQEGVGDGRLVDEDLLGLSSPSMRIDHALIDSHRRFMIIQNHQGIHIGKAMQNHLGACRAENTPDRIFQFKGYYLQIGCRDPFPKPSISFEFPALLVNPAFAQLIPDELFLKVHSGFKGIRSDKGCRVGLHQTAIFHSHTRPEAILEVEGVDVFLGIGIHIAVFPGVSTPEKLKVIRVIKASILLTHKVDGHAAVLIFQLQSARVHRSQVPCHFHAPKLCLVVNYLLQVGSIHLVNPILIHDQLDGIHSIHRIFGCLIAKVSLARQTPILAAGIVDKEGIGSSIYRV